MTIAALASLAVVVAGLLATEQPLNASTGSPPDWHDVREAARSMFIARSVAVTSPNSFRLAVTPVLIGASPDFVSYVRVAGEPSMPPGSRWVVITYDSDKGLATDPSKLNGRWDPAFQVSPDGKIDWGRIVEAPPTITQLLVFFGLPATDAATSGPSDDQTLGLALRGLAAGFGVVVALAFLNRRRHRLPSPPAESRG